MIRAVAGLGLAAIACGMAFGQSADATSKFEIADVHVSAKTVAPPRNTEALRGGRYEIHAATMVDLIHSAWGFDPTKIMGGPSWLGTDRFDVTARVPENIAPETLHTMLQSLLADRFKLVVHKDTRPVPTWTLTAGNKPLLKPADGSGDSGCRMQPPPQGSPGFTLFFSCRKMTMADFAAGLGTMRGVDVGRETVLDQTGLKGAWNFDVSWSPIGAPSLPGMEPSITAFDALNKQLGLKLERKPVPAPVMVVDSVNEKPTDNPPGVAEAFPVVSLHAAFDLADIKLSDPNSRGMRYEVQPGGRVVIQGMSMSQLLSRALGFNTASYRVAGLPGWAGTDRFDITAKAPLDVVLTLETITPMFRALLEERFKLATHTEERPVSTYSLVAAKPKLTKSDPANRSGCRRVSAPPGTPLALSWTITCQNTTLAQFAEQLTALNTGYVNVPVVDTTGLDGAWDFTFNFSPLVVRTGGPGASEPDGTVTLFDAMEKQLGLKLKEEKRPEPVLVIDHLEERPTEN